MQQEKTFTEFRLTADDGIRLYGRMYGPGNGGRPVVCLAGLSRNSRDFHQIAGILADAGRKVVTLDCRGRGLSDRDPNPANYTLLREARDVMQAAAHLGIREADFIGTSRGGLLLHLLPALAPGLVGSAVLNDVGPVIEIEGLRKIRDYLSARPEPQDFSQAASALKALHGGDFPALGDRDWLEMADAVFREVDGRITPDYDPALVEPLKMMDLNRPAPDLWEQFTGLFRCRLLILRGENSSLLSISTVAEMLRRHPNAQAAAVSGQGHAPLLHIGDAAAEVTSFLARS